MNFVSQFNVKADILMDKLLRMADGKTLVNLFHEINRATLDAIALVYIYYICICYLFIFQKWNFFSLKRLPSG